jgi:hypothetical protein
LTTSKIIKIRTRKTPQTFKINTMETTTTTNNHNQSRQSFKVTTEVEIPSERVADMLCCAFEGGSNYWAEIKEKRKPEEFAFRYMPDLSDKPTSYTDYPLNRGGFLMVGDSEGDMPAALLDLGTIRLGLQTMADKYPNHWHDFINDNEDAFTGDVFLQCCLYGEVVFG